MSPKEKASDLINKFYPSVQKIAFFGDEVEDKNSKKCAIIAVDEIIAVCPYVSKKSSDTVEQLRAYDNQFIDYWKKVKAEIEKL